MLARFVRAPSHVLVVLLCSAFAALQFYRFFSAFLPLPPLPIALLGRVFSAGLLVSVWRVMGLGLGLAGGARGWVAGRAGLWGVLPGFGDTSPQAPGHPTSICDIGVNLVIIGGKKEDKKIKFKKKRAEDCFPWKKSHPPLGHVSNGSPVKLIHKGRWRLGKVCGKNKTNTAKFYQNCQYSLKIWNGNRATVKVPLTTWRKLPFVKLKILFILLMSVTFA